MSGVLERLQALVTTAVRKPEGPVAGVCCDTDSTASVDSRAPIGDTHRPSSEHEKQGRWRRRRQTDATVSSVSTVGSAGSADGGAAATASPSPSPSVSAAASSKQEMEKLLWYRMRDLERLSRLHPVSKVLQQEAWDCGLACVCMLLRASGQPTCSVAQLARQAQTASVWTVDLAFLIRRNLPHADFTYYTAWAGVNPDHSQNRFYDDMLDDDERRVMQLFANARTGMSVHIVEIAIPLLDLKRFLVHRQYVAVLLVDSAELKCTVCARARSFSSAGPRTHSRSRSVNIFRSSKPAEAAAPTDPPSRSSLLSWFSRKRRARDGYLGHYILLFAYIPSLDVFLYRDPAIPEEFCLASADIVNTARTRPGTDADCIIVKL
ncbi:hypothetical protein LPJ59_004009 [Coemansia sp. RSA 2399]|nr:hypothetical protein LPJ59_004009 [Coemansia sp. RSA 2399]KAJ1901804.1 hypothetical protein LPJ81_003696 [Coemansia sp. IMI 209127]